MSNLLFYCFVVQKENCFRVVVGFCHRDASWVARESLIGDPEYQERGLCSREALQEKEYQVMFA